MRLGIFLLLFLPTMASAQVVINEIAWMGTSVSANDEWIELYNSSSGISDLQGLILGAADGQPNITLSGEISAGGYFLLERTDDETMPGIAADLIYTGALSNSGEKFELKNAAGTIIDSVDASGGWSAGDNTTKETMQRLNAGNWITDSGTPRATNAVITNQGTNQEAGGNTSNVPQTFDVEESVVIQEPKKSFTVDAGEDIKTVAGAETRFSGAAFGFTGAPLEDDTTRYLWNFGDGAFFEAKNTNHIYRYPGIYRAMLYVSSDETSGSDVVDVRVGESNVVINEIASAWIEIANEGVDAIDMSSWQMRNGAGQAYALPPRTIIGPRAFAVFSQETTGFFFGPVNPKAELRYANGALADTIYFAGTLLPEKSMIRDGEGNVMIGEQTPGRGNKIVKGIHRNTVEIPSNTGEIRDNVFHEQARSEGEQISKDFNEFQNEKEIRRNTVEIRGNSLRASMFHSNYFWLAVSISMGLIAGAVVLWSRAVVLF